MKVITVFAACLATATSPLMAMDSQVLYWPDLPPQIPEAKQIVPHNAHWQPTEPQQEETTPRRNLYQWPPPAPEGGWTPSVAMGTPTTPRRETYRVIAGDNLYRIMRKTGIPIKKLASLNKLTDSSYQIRKGQILRLK